MGRLAPIPGLRTTPGLSFSCALGHPNGCRTYSRAVSCTCECHQPTGRETQR